MKKTILLPLLLLILLASSQPKLAGTLAFYGQKNGGGIFRVDMPGPGPGVIHPFDNLSPHRPTTGVVAGDLDWLYGVLTYNGIDNKGGLYKIRKDGSGFTMVYNFTNPYNNYITPYYHTDSLIYFSDGLELKKLDPATNIVTGYVLNSAIISKNLLIDTADWVYILTVANTISKIKTDGTQWTDLHTFNGATEGSGGIAGLTETPGDSLFGVQTYGGTSNGGTIFSIKKNGSGFTVLHQFSTATGIYPESRLEYFDGKLFGTTTQGGDFGNGVLYTINADGSDYRILSHFGSGISFGTATPNGNISISSNGRIFGGYAQFLTNSFGNYRLFKTDTSGDNFANFFPVDQRQHGNLNKDILLVNDTIFLTTLEMGRHDGGVLSVSDTSGSATTLYQFGTSVNGFRPDNLMKASDGKIYGTTKIGGADGNGTIYSINANGSGYTKLHEFVDAEGYEPAGKLLQANDGKIYGALKSGGPGGAGSLYRVDTNGNNFSIIYYLNSGEGYSPVGGLIEDNNGILYGATVSGGPSGLGILFKINKDGSNYSVLKYFNGGNDFAFPYNGLILSNGYLYGTAGSGGTGNNGGVFRIRTNGSSYQVLHEFLGGADGSLPTATPMIASNGKLYGTTINGGSNGFGIVYRIDTSGSNFTILKQFVDTIDGAYPYASLIQASDGLIYGATLFGTSGSSGGTIFKMNLDGSSFSIVRSFNLDTEGQGIYSLLDLNGPVILPVQLLTFTAQKTGQYVLLNWKTAQEQNSDRFEVERSADGNRFISIGSLTASGNTRAVKSYSFTDLNPLKGSNFYRLKQLDKDETFSYSKVVSVNFNKLEKLFISPNPASDQLEVQLPQANSYTSLVLFDASGKLVLQKGISNSSAIHLDIHHLSSGWYVLKLQGKESQQLSFIKR